MGCHTWDPSKSHGHIFAGPTWAATPGAQKDAHMKPSWVPLALADWGMLYVAIFVLFLMGNLNMIFQRIKRFFRGIVREVFVKKESDFRH